MGPKLLDSILTIRAGLKRNSVCCSKYKLPSSILKQIGSTSIYPSQETNYNEEMISVESTEDIIIY